MYLHTFWHYFLTIDCDSDKIKGDIDKTENRKDNNSTMHVWQGIIFNLIIYNI